jgi:integrase
VVALPTRAEIHSLIDALPSDVWRMALRLAVVTGARRGELCGLKRSDIDLRAGYIRIRRSVYRHNGANHEKVTKSGKERLIVVGDAASDLLAAWSLWCIERSMGVATPGNPPGRAVAPGQGLNSTRWMPHG